jgi:hypothetical protein
MEAAFGYVLFGVVIVGGLIAVATLFVSGRAYDQIGRGGFFRDTDGARPASGSAGDLAERDDEIRQMLTARNARRAARGEAVVDVEAELARLTAPVADPGLRDEIRQLVIAGNARRVRRGQEPLDVEAEVERRLRELG